MAWLLGINVRRIEITVFVVASVIAGAAGCLIGVSMGTVGPFMGANLLLTASSSSSWRDLAASMVR